MRIDINHAVSGMVLYSDIKYDKGILVNKGEVLTPRRIQQLKKFGITYIDVVSEKAQNMQNEAEKHEHYTVDNALFFNVRESLLEGNLEKIESNVQSIVNAVLNNIDANRGFSNLTYDFHTFQNQDDTLNHSVRVAIYAIVLAHLHNEKIKKGKTKPENFKNQLIDLKDIAIAALLQEKGRNCYRQDVLEKIRMFTQYEELRNQLPGLRDIPTDRYDDKYISLYSYCLICDIPQISMSAKYMVLFSEETENNMGPLKPKGFAKQNSSSTILGAKIIHLCDLYDDMLAHCMFSGETLENIVGVLGQSANMNVINRDLANLFLSNVPICPIGTKLILSNGEKAEVVKAFTGYTYATRPIVKVLSTNQLIDLRYVTSLTIGSVYFNESSLSDMIDHQMKEVDSHSRK